MQKLLPKVHTIELQKGEDYAKIIIEYIAYASRQANFETLLEEAKSHLSSQLVGETMTIAEELLSKGRLQGEQIGIQKGEQIGIRKCLQTLSENFLQRGVDPNLLEELEKLAHGMQANTLK